MKSKFDFKNIDDFLKRLEREGLYIIVKKVKESAVKGLAAELLDTVIAITPRRPSSIGGTLQRGWTGGIDISPQAYAERIPIKTDKYSCQLDIINPVKYAKYVEYGHRTRNNGWEEGKFMLEKASNVVSTYKDSFVYEKIIMTLRKLII